MKTCEEKDKKWEMDIAFRYRVSNNLITDTTEMLGSAYLFNKTVTAASPLVPRTSLATRFCLSFNYQMRISPCRSGLKSNQKVCSVHSYLCHCLSIWPVLLPDPSITKHAESTAEKDYLSSTFQHHKNNFAGKSHFQF